MGTVRGLHLQAPPFAQGKLLSVVKGAIFDVAVDVRSESPTYGQWASIELSEDDHTQFWIPVGFLHGFQTLQSHTIVSYKCSNFYNSSFEMGVRYDDTSLSIEWPLPSNNAISAKDFELPKFEKFCSPF